MWYYIKDGEQAGPENPAAISALIRNGTIGPDTLVWRDGFADWVEARTTELSSEFQGNISVQPPDAPSTKAARAPARGQNTPGVATASLVLGILSWVMFGPLTAIPAVICGHIGMSRIKNNPETLTGRGMALAGLIMGYLQIVIALLIALLLTAIVVPSFLKAREVSQFNSCVGNLRMIDSGKEQWALVNKKEAGAEPDVDGVNEYIKGNTTPICAESGTYTYHVIGEDPECSVHGSMSAAQSGH